MGQNPPLYPVLSPQQGDTSNTLIIPQVTQVHPQLLSLSTCTLYSLSASYTLTCGMPDTFEQHNHIPR